MDDTLPIPLPIPPVPIFLPPPPPKQVTFILWVILICLVLVIRSTNFLYPHRCLFLITQAYGVIASSHYLYLTKSISIDDNQTNDDMVVDKDLSITIRKGKRTCTMQEIHTMLLDYLANACKNFVVALDGVSTPTTHQHALLGPKWQQGMEEEMAVLQNWDTLNSQIYLGMH